MAHSHPILLFDGVCNLCNGFVQFMLTRDPEGIFQFASLQSEEGRSLLLEYGLDPEGMDTVVLIENGQAYTHSDVPLRVAPRLAGFWGWVSIFKYVPRSWRNAIYRWVAANRYRWFGKQESCIMPRPEWKERFL